jgi:hypothetical protein
VLFRSEEALRELLVDDKGVELKDILAESRDQLRFRFFRQMIVSAEINAVLLLASPVRFRVDRCLPVSRLLNDALTIYIESFALTEYLLPKYVVTQYSHRMYSANAQRGDIADDITSTSERIPLLRHRERRLACFEREFGLPLEELPICVDAEVSDDSDGSVRDAVQDFGNAFSVHGVSTSSRSTWCVGYLAAGIDGSSGRGHEQMTRCPDDSIPIQFFLALVTRKKPAARPEW